MTYVAQKSGGSVVSFEAIRPGIRIANAFVSYIIYLGKTIWPVNLALFYPYPGSLPLWQTLGAVLLLIAVSISVIRTAKRLPYLTMGWLWFTGTLVPVIGVVQVGSQAMADRYTYIPLIGLFVMAAWGIPELLEKWRPSHPLRKEALFASSSLVLLSLFIVARTQVGYWRNSITLYDHALKVTNCNDTIHNSRGVAYGELGDYRQAISDFDLAVQINPEYAEAYYSRGLTYGKLGDYRRAIPDFDKAIQINPEYAEAYNNRGVAYDKLGNYRRAISDYNRVIESNPEYAEAYNNRGAAYGMLDNPRQAIEDFDKAIEINPKYAEAYNNRGVSYGKLSDRRRATEDMITAARLDNEDAKNYLRIHGVNW